MAEERQQKKAQGFPPPYDLNAKWDACLDLTARRLAYSSLAGAFTALLFFSESSPPQSYIPVRSFRFHFGASNSTNIASSVARITCFGIDNNVLCHRAESIVELAKVFSCSHGCHVRRVFTSSGPIVRESKVPITGPWGSNQSVQCLWGGEVGTWFPPMLKVGS
ncbi:hypothetical protein B296_00012834 [Ensete ventricosum]|uniref:Uncharacterized protein n=1 Tax=Ensete ventricosum TaxID=4639 RepID=A0A427A3J6_ENSVE|nr:hypothetical protein B296_00012834 [Ensete ventricosum]